MRMHEIFEQSGYEEYFLGLGLNFRTVRGTRDSDSNNKTLNSDSDPRPAGLGLGLESGILELGLGLDSRYAGLGLGKRWTRYISMKMCAK
jgi:hypothetical protein